MLVSLYRTGPLRHRIAKGFIVVADDPCTVLDAVQARPPDLPGHAAGRLSLYRDGRSAGAVWLDTGMIWLTEPGGRADLRRCLTEGAVTLARAVRGHGGRLVPSGWLGARGTGDWLCPDLHAVEILSDTQRELCTNLFRTWVPELIALTGHAAFGGARLEHEGSRRLADATDHLSTRYLASASPTHLSRVRDSLRRDEGVSRLELMDINPFGLSDPVPNVVVRCVDAQVFPATVLAHAVLIQAVAMRARQFERDGRRVPAGQQRVLDRNRSRAISSGLAGSFDTGTDARRAERGRQPSRRKEETKAPVSVPARERVLRLMEELTPQLQAMRVRVEEIAPMALGLTMAGSHPMAVRTENDVIGRWVQSGTNLDTVDFFGDAGWLDVDRLSEANAESHRGATALARTYWSGRLTPAAPPNRAGPRTGPQALDRAEEAERAERPTRRTGPFRVATPNRQPAGNAATQALFAALGTDGLSARDVTRAVTDYLRTGGAADLMPDFRRLPGEQAKAMRRTLRPARSLTREAATVPADWQHGAAAEVQRLARRDGRALLSVKLPGDQRGEAVAVARQHVRQPPDGVGILLMTDAVYRDNDGGQMARIELLLVAMATGPAQ